MKVLFFIVLAFCLTYCERSEYVYRGPLMVAFSEQEMQVPNGYGIDYIPVQMIGALQRKEVLTRFKMIDSLTTAINGVHFQLITQGDVKFKALNNESNIIIDILSSTMADDVKITFELTDEGEIYPSANFKRLTYIIKK